MANLLAEMVLAGRHERREVGREPAQRLDGAAFRRRQPRETELAGLLFGRRHVERRIERSEEQGIAVAAGRDLGAEAEGEDHVVVRHVVERVARVEAGGFVEEPEGGGFDCGRSGVGRRGASCNAEENKEGGDKGRSLGVGAPAFWPACRTEPRSGGDR